MEKYQQILAIIDPTTEDQKALKRAIELATQTKARITAFLSIYDFSYELTTMLSSDEREAMRQSLIMIVLNGLMNYSKLSLMMELLSIQM